MTMENLKQQNPVTSAVETLQFPAKDRYMLTGKCYKTTRPVKAKMIVTCATGVPQAFYRRFAEYMAQSGYEVFTFDYRGVGLSAPKHLKGFKMSYLDWGALDLVGAIDFQHDPNLPLFVIGHSFGGQALGLCENHYKVNAMYCFGTGAGWAGYMPFKEKFKVSVMWNIIFPPMVALSGYLPWSKLNMGADLPIGVYQQWRKWCKNPTYFFGDPALQTLKTQYAQVQSKIYAYSALDDDWALPNSRYAFMQHYTGADMKFINICPEDYGLKHIGHMGYFRQGSEKIWTEILEGLNTLVSSYKLNSHTI